MAQPISKLRPWTIYLGSYNALINGACSWGSKYVAQIPTQQILPAMIVGAVFSLTGIGTAVVADRLGINRYICNYFDTPLQKKAEATQNIFITFYILNFSLATFGALAFTPTLATLAHRSISYQATAVFTLINNFSTIILIKLLLKNQS